MQIRKLEDLSKEELLEYIEGLLDVNRDEVLDLIKRLKASPTSEIMLEAAETLTKLIR